MRQVESSGHTRWECKYHILFIPKYRRKQLFGQIRKEPGEAEGEFVRGRVYFGGSFAYDDFDSCEICGIAGSGIYQGEDRPLRAAHKLRSPALPGNTYWFTFD